MTRAIYVLQSIYVAPSVRQNLLNTQLGFSKFSCIVCWNEPIASASVNVHPNTVFSGSALACSLVHSRLSTLVEIHCILLLEAKNRSLARIPPIFTSYGGLCRQKGQCHRYSCGTQVLSPLYSTSGDMQQSVQTYLDRTSQIKGYQDIDVR